MNDQSIISDARRWTQETLHSAHYSSYLNSIGNIWKDNIQYHLHSIIHSSVTLREIYDKLNKSTFYDINFGPRHLLEASIRWRDCFYTKQFSHSCPPWYISESNLIDDDRCFRLGEHRVSADLMWRLTILKRLETSIPFPIERFKVLEIGGGYGAFARTMKLKHPQCSYMIADLPHSLFFQYCFLKDAFPDSTHSYITSDNLGALPDSDFVYIPHKYLSLLEGTSCFLALNTNSFGEMPLSESSRYAKFIQENMQVEYLFSLNRLLNRINNDLLPSRTHCVGHSFQYDRNWEVIDWEVDPDYERCPFLTTLLTRNAHVIMKRNSTGANASDNAKSLSLSNVELEDWNTTPYWHNYNLHLNGELGQQYPPIMSRADRDLTPDLTMSGTLFRLLEYYRVSGGTAHATRLLIRYLAHLGGILTPFEEFLYLINRQVEANSPTL